MECGTSSVVLCEVEGFLSAKTSPASVGPLFFTQSVPESVGDPKYSLANDRGSDSQSVELSLAGGI